MVEKRTYTQADFSLGVTIPELIDGDDTDIRAQSLKDGKNLRVTRGRSLRGRPGLEIKVNVAGDQSLHDMRVQTDDGEVLYIVVVEPNGLQVWDSNYGFVQRWTSAPWGNFENGRPWVAQFENALIFGGYEFYAIQYNDGTFTFDALAFTELPGGELAIPYWVYERGVFITPSAYSGSVTVTASSGIFSEAWVGKRIRYSKKEIVLTAFTSATQMTGAVTTELPPTFEITFGSAAHLSGFNVGEVVTASETNWSGIVVEITGAVMYAVTVLGDAATASYGGPVASEEIVGTNASKSPSSVSKASTPRGTTVWDEQLWSDHRGWPQSGSEVNNRLALCNFAKVPNLVCLSSSRRFNDFGLGAADDDAILRTAGNRNPRFRHIVNSTDLILLADRGCYYVKTRDGELVTPSNFQVVQFDERGTSEVAPVAADNAVVFIEKNKGTVCACTLTGNVYLNWSVVELTRFHAHLISSPVALCGPAADPSMSERYMMVVNSDGTMAVMSWFTTFGEEVVGFVPWETTGRTIERAFPLLDRYHCIVKNGDSFTLEMFNPAFYVDGGFSYSGPLNGGVLATDAGDPITLDDGTEIKLAGPAFAHLANLTVKAWSDYETVATDTVNASGQFSETTEVTADQVGVAIDVRATPWPREVLESPRRGMIKSRVIRCAVAVRDTVNFAFRRNSTTTTTPVRRPYDDVSAPPPLKTDWYRFNVYGNRAHPEMEIFLPEPNPIEITSIAQEVQA